MTSDFDLDGGIGGERCRYDVENRVGVGFQRRAPGFEGYATEYDGRLGLGEEDRTTCRIDTRACRGTGAFVLGVVDAVAVTVGRALATCRIDFRPCRRVGAFVEAVGHAILVAVDWTAGRVHGGAGRRVGTLIGPIGNTIGVRVRRTSLRIHAGPGHRSGALVDPVVHAVRIGVFGAAAGVDLCVLDRIRTGIEAVEDPVAVGVGRAAARVHHSSCRGGRAGVLAVGYAVLVGVAECARPREDGEAGGRDYVSGPVAAGEPRAGSVDRASLDSQGDALAEEYPISECAMNGVVGGAVAGEVAEFDMRVAAQEIEEVVPVAEVEAEAAAPQSERGIDAAGPWGGLLIAQLGLEPDHRTEEVPEAATAADLIIEIERVIVARERSERADFELMCMLSKAEGWNGIETQQQQRRLRAHVNPPRFGRHCTLIMGTRLRNPL